MGNERILALDTGTNSLGWAIVERDDKQCHLIDKGVYIFQEGVKIEKGEESSKASERTGHRALRRRYYRIKLRKIRLLRILSDNHLCPPLTPDELSQWRLQKRYPANELFLQWQRTDDKEGINPYYYRHLCLHKKLDMEVLSQRYIIGRALYHIIQRRGFLSNRKDAGDNESGKVKEGISALSDEMRAAQCEYLGDYYYELYNRGEKIRTRYTAREEHYLREFNAICQIQEIDADLTAKLRKAIFDQRPLKSQKGVVGRCVFEKKKARCPVSHPLFEEYRMLAFINNIKIRTPQDRELRPLNQEERALAIPLFFRKSKRNFDFEDIAKKIAKKRSYGFYKKDAGKEYLFNFPMETSAAGCSVTAQLREIFGEEWVKGICECYLSNQEKKAKSELDIINDVWHALFFYSDESKLAEFAKKHLQLGDDDAQKFSKIKTPSEYASLSLKAINKILPYLRQGKIYSHAVFLANLCEVAPDSIWEDKGKRAEFIDDLTGLMECYEPKKGGPTLEACLKSYLGGNAYYIPEERLNRLYHPSMIEAYPRVQPNADGIYQLGSPRTSSIRNPMAMRSLFCVRRLVNRLLSERKIDNETTIHIELARELNDANKRKALADDMRNKQRERDQARKKIMDMYRDETGKDIEPTDADILKYQLWEEQNHQCLYTGRNIGITDFIGANPEFDIEHTIPRSAGGDSTKMNLTLCDSKFNREIKKTQLPTQLRNHPEILMRIEGWKKNYEALDSRIRKLRTAGLTTKDEKDSVIQKRNLLSLERDYWKGKYSRFTMKEVPEGFSRRQLGGAGIISRYARLFLKSVFGKVYVVKGTATADFRKIWGIQEIYTKKERVNHVHHCIDAIVIACIGPNEYADLARYYHEEENQRWYGLSRASFPKPWETFVEDIKKVQEEILVKHYTTDNMPKQGRRRIRIGRQRVMSRGDAARGPLHNDTYYGAIWRFDEKKQKEAVRYVKRVAIASLREADIKNIVDDTVRGIIEQFVAINGIKALTNQTVWMNREKGVPIKKVRCFARVSNPLHIRHHRDISPKEYKRQFNVVNDRNYAMAIYVGRDSKGKEKRDFEIATNLQAAQYFRASRTRDAHSGTLLPAVSPKGFPLAYTLKIGTMVLLYENNPYEIWKSDKTEQIKRLYKVTGLSSMNVSGNLYGVLTMVHHQEARQSTDFKAKNGPYKKGETFRPAIRMLHTQIKVLVEGRNFEINELGEIKRLDNHD